MSPKVKDYSESHGWKPMTSSEQPGIPERGRLLVIFVPAWSKKDFDIVDAIACKIGSTPMDVRVYDIDDFESQEAIQGLFPMVPAVNQTPVLIFYVDGILQSFVQGEDAAMWSIDA